MKNYENILKEWFGFDKFRDKQLDIIKVILEDKKDVCAIMCTGFGKSLCFQFPAVYTSKICLVISPLISLMNDQRLKLNKLGITSCCLNSTVPNKNKLKEEILENEYRVVYTTPEYLITQEDFIFELIDRDILCLFCIDEAHCCSTYGNDFRESYKKLNCLREWAPTVPIATFTATATKRVQSDIINILKLKNPFVIKSTFDRPNLIIKVIPKGHTPMMDLLNVIVKNEPTIVYCQTRNMTDEISASLNKNKIISESYHAGMGSIERNTVHENFSSGKLNCVVATIAFGMGIDITIRKVIHYGIPKDMESYYQEIGRAGRDGLKAECYMFYALSDMNHNNYFVNQIKNVQYRNHMLHLALTMKTYIFSSQCRRKYILEYFSEDYKKDNCEACDNCFNKKSILTHDFTKDAKLLFDTMILTNNAYGGTMIINILRGSGSKKILNKHRKSSLFGAGKHHTEQWWKIFLTMTINNQFIKEYPIGGGHGFTLSNTKKSMEWLALCKTKPDTQLLLSVPEDMKKLLPIKTKPNLTIDTNYDDDITIAQKMDEIIESITQTDAKPIAQMDAKLNTTYDMFHKQGKSIKEISIHLNVGKETIEKYIVKLYEKGYVLDLNKLQFTNEIYNLISNKIIELGNPIQLGIIKNNLPYNISYLQIKLSMVKMEKDKINNINNTNNINNANKSNIVVNTQTEKYVIAKGKKKIIKKNDDDDWIFEECKYSVANSHTINIDNTINNAIDNVITNINKMYLRNKSIDDEYNKLFG